MRIPDFDKPETISFYMQLYFGITAGMLATQSAAMYHRVRMRVWRNW